jgi:peptidoglycan/xylan/chitin deacetylase (PgdA/CDA1 family)
MRPMGGATAVILGFHKIGAPPANGWSTWNYIPETTFTGYLESIRRLGWQVLDLDRFVTALRDPGTLPERALLLTFDDGCRSMLTVAAPLLERFGCPAVLFVPTDHVGGTNVFDHGNEPDEPLCTWAELRALHARGVAIQSHAASHRPFSDLDQHQRDDEIRRSKAAIEREVGAPAHVLAFPFGDAGRDPQETGRLLAQAGYRAACCYGGAAAAVALPTSAPFGMPRLAIGPDTDLEATLRALEERR